MMQTCSALSWRRRALRVVEKASFRSSRYRSYSSLNLRAKDMVAELGDGRFWTLPVMTPEVGALLPTRTELWRPSSSELLTLRL